MTGRTVLIADDDPLLCDLVVNALRIAGHEAGAVRNGREALDYVRRQRTDLIILDACMPVMDGYQTLGVLKASPACRHIPVLMLTARRDRRDVVTARDLGAAGYVIKPFAVPALLERVSGMLTRRPLAPDTTGRAAGIARIDNTEWID